MNFESNLLASGFVKQKEMFHRILFGTVELAFMGGADNGLDDQSSDEWFVYLNDRLFSAAMESAFANDGEFFNAYMKRKLRKDKTGNLGMVLSLLSQNEDGEICFQFGNMEISTVDFFEIPFEITDYSKLINHMLADSGFGTFFSFTEGYYVYLYLCNKAGLSANETYKTLREKIETAPFLAEYMSKKNIEMIDEPFVERFFSYVK